jgi:hypothetical protein
MHTESTTTWALKPYKPWLQDQPYEVLEPERECTYCHDSWPLDGEFWNQDAKNPQGFGTQCKACISEKAAAVRLKKKNNPVAKVELAPLTEKPCSTCKVVKKLSRDFFHGDPRNRDGFSSQCIVCKYARVHARKLMQRANKKTTTTVRGVKPPIAA